VTDEASLYDLSDEGRARQKAAQAAARGTRTKGLLIVNTGNGKGKTTAALGLLLRAWGRDMSVVMYQFLKPTTANFGEIKAAKKLGIEIRPVGKGFTWMSQDIATDEALARAGWAAARQAIEAGSHHIVILDEFTYPLSFGWVAVDEVLAVLAARKPSMHVVVTGRKAVPELVEAADLVTEMTEVKHPYRAGIKAQKGIEF
jgi:cob(I)alamin adenosyltransferase